MDELPSRRFSKPVRGRILLKSAGPGSGGPGAVGPSQDRRVDYIEVARGRDGTMVYVLNVWRRPGIPWVVRASEVEAVEPFERPTC